MLINLDPTVFTDNETLDIQISDMGDSRDKNQRIIWFTLKTDWDKDIWEPIQKASNRQINTEAHSTKYQSSSKLWSHKNKESPRNKV